MARINTGSGWTQLSAGAAGIPVGGTANQLLTKNSTTDFDAVWRTPLTVNDGSLVVQNTTDPTKQVLFDASAIGTGTARTFTWPNRTDTVVVLGAAQTLTSKTIVAGAVAPVAGVTSKVDSQGGGGNTPYHASGGYLGLDFMATEFNGLYGSLDLRGGINVGSLSALALGSGAATTAGQTMGEWHIGGSHNDALIDTAMISCVATENYSGDTHTASGSRWQVWSTPNQTEVRECQFTIDHDGQLYPTSPDTFHGATAGANYAGNAQRPIAFIGTKGNQTFNHTFASPTAPTFVQNRAVYVIGAVSPNAPFHTGFLQGPTVKNDPAINTDFATGLNTCGYAFRDITTIQVDTATGKSIGFYRSFIAAPTVNRINSGTITTGSIVCYVTAPTVGAGITLQTVTHVLVTDTANSGSVATQVGVDIGALAGGTTNIGIRNASVTQLGATQQCVIDTSGNFSTIGSIGYATGAGGTVTQTTSRTAAVTINKLCGAITMFAAAGTTTWTNFMVNNSLVAATDLVNICIKSAGNTYGAFVVSVNAGSFIISFSALSGTTSDTPVITFAVIKAVAA